MRIAYGVHGYSRGHATRAMSVLTGLGDRHDVLVYAGGDAYDLLAPHFQVQRIPSLGFLYRSNGQRSTWRSVLHNAPLIGDLVRFGPTVREVADSMRSFRPDVVISDAEPWTHRAGQALRIPRIGFDHFGIMVYCKVPIPLRDRLRSMLDVVVYRLLMGSPQHVLVSSFYDAPSLHRSVRVVAPLLRDEVHQLRATQGEHLLAYFNQGARQLTDSVLGALNGVGCEVRVYGGDRRGPDGNLVFCPPSNRPFLEDLASCRAVISTAGNQLVGEAIHFGKPMLVMPERLVEQRLNAAAIARLGIGEVTDFGLLDPEVIHGFLARAPHYAEMAQRQARDGRAEAIDTIERWMAQLPEPRKRRQQLVEVTA